MALNFPEAASAGRRDEPVRLGVLALARNCESTLPAFFQWLRALEEQGFACSSWVGENGSADRTRVLLEAQASPTFTVLDTSFMADAATRLARMAKGREALLKTVEGAGLDFHFICVADLDNVMISPPSPLAVRDALQHFERSAAFAVGATSDPYYYDLLSLQARGHDYRTLQGEIDEAKKNPFTYYQFQRDRIFQIQRQLSIREPWECLSSFNGLCMYRTEDFFLGNYRAPDEADVCEHVNFNLSIARATGRSMLVVPELRIHMPEDHAPVGFLRFWADRVGKAFRR